MKLNRSFAVFVSFVIGAASLFSVTINPNQEAIVQAATVDDLTSVIYPKSETYLKQIDSQLVSPEDYPIITTTITTTTTTTRVYTTTTTTTPIIYTTTTTPPPPTPRIQKGMIKYDINNNGVVNIADAVFLTRIISEDPNVKMPKNGNPDVNNDGLLTLSDVMDLLNAFKPFSLKIGKTTGQPGTRVTIPVEIFADKGTAGGQVYISYDSRLTPVSIRTGDAYSAHFQTEWNSYPLYIGWIALNGLDQKAADGAILAYLDFEIDANIRQTEFLTISVTNLTKFSDSDGYTYSANYRDGYITVIP